MNESDLAQQVMDDDGAGSAITSNLVQVSYDEDSIWCQEHGHSGLLTGSVCGICDELDASVSSPDERRSADRSEWAQAQKPLALAQASEAALCR